MDVGDWVFGPLLSAMTVPGANQAGLPANTTQTGLAAGRSGNFHDTGRVFVGKSTKHKNPPQRAGKPRSHSGKRALGSLGSATPETWHGSCNSHGARTQVRPT